MSKETDSAARLIGFALFNLSKGNYFAAEVLLNQAYTRLTGKPWDYQGDTDGQG